MVAYVRGWARATCIPSDSMKITERNPKNSNENEKRRQKVKSAKSAKMGKGNIFLNHRIMFSYKIPH